MNKQLDDAWDQGRRPEPTKGKSDKFILRYDRRRYVTVSHANKLTKAGEYLRTKGWNPPNLRFDMYQRPIHRGNSEYLKTHDGKQILGRTWDTKTGTWRYTERGKEYYSASVQIVVQIPAIIFQRGKGSLLARIVFDRFFSHDASLI